MSQFQRYLSAVVSQGFVSLFHLGLNLFLIRRLVESDYGTFALAFAISLIAAAVTNAMFTVPLSVFRPSATDESEQRDIDGTLNRGAFMLAGAVILAGIVWAMIAALNNSPWTSAAAAAFIATYALRQHGRGGQYAVFQASVVFRADGVYVLVSVVSIVVSGLWFELSAAWVLCGLTIGNIGSMLVLFFRRARTPNDRRPLLDAYRPYWTDSKWALLGAVSTMIVAQGHSVLVSAIRDPEVFAPLAAGFVVYGPVRVLFATIQNVLRPEMAKSIAEGQQRSANRQAALASLASLAAVLLVSTLLYLAWDPIFDRLYRERYSDEPMAEIALMWALVSAVAGLGSGPSALLQSMREFRVLAVLGLFAGMLNLVLVTVILLVSVVQFTILGVAMAEATMAIGMVELVRRSRPEAGRVLR